jgi:hypothetical protein
VHRILRDREIIHHDLCVPWVVNFGPCLYLKETAALISVFQVFIYWLTILVSAVVSQSRGNSKVWTTPVKDAVFFSQQAISSDSGNKTKQEMEEGTAAARASKQIHLWGSAN